MKTLLLICIYIISFGAFAQAPAIEGDVMLCPYTNGTATITTGQTYDTYQWYFKYWFLDDEYEAIEGATSASFIYDWFTYDQALLKVVVTQNGTTYESNSIQIDSHAWAGLIVTHQTNENVASDGQGGFLFCEGGSITNTIGSPYTIIQWYKDDVAIEGATGQSYVITQPGIYHATAAPDICPNSSSTTPPITVTASTDCATANTPVIAGDTLLCPDTDGTAQVTNGFEYDTYQWYVSSFFTDDEFEPIEGATSSSFTYDWDTYDQAIFKVVVTLNGATYESNTIQIDSYNWAGLIVNHVANEFITPDGQGGFLFCEGGSITNTVGSPYTIIQWYKDGVAIEGATGQDYVITEPGVYTVTAAPGFCPNSTSTSPPIVVTTNTDCATESNTPVIDGDIMLCPYTNGTAQVINGIEYDTYQWYYKYWFLDDEYEAIEGATSASFTYDWLTYDQALLKLVVTLNGATYESNSIQIDSHNWQGLVFSTSVSEGVSFDPDEVTYLICEGDYLTNTLPEIFTENIQWYRDGVAIEGATEPTYVITEPGSYHVVASPSTCPSSSNTTVTYPLVVAADTDCTAGLDNPDAAPAFTLYPNPATSTITIAVNPNTQLDTYAVYDITGKALMQGKATGIESVINVSALASGTYIIKVNSGNTQATQLFIKQ